MFKADFTVYHLYICDTAACHFKILQGTSCLRIVVLQILNTFVQTIVRGETHCYVQVVDSIITIVFQELINSRFPVSGILKLFNGSGSLCFNS